LHKIGGVPPSGPHDELTTRGNFGNAVEPVITTAPWLQSADLDSAIGDSNVLFLPGLEGSRLYDEQEKLWEPFDFFHDGVASLLGVADARVARLALGADSDTSIHAKEGDILDESAGSDYYHSFMQQLERLKTAGAIADWSAIAYDWRYSPEWIASHGEERDDSIFYETSSDVPYIEQKLRALAATSKSGKVTIVAHSYGGLVAKALMQRLGDAETSATYR
jgi:pimeloyl-ACP methyl ester carboxylesterase